MATDPEVQEEVTHVSIEPAPEGSEIVETPEGEAPAEGAEPAAPVVREPKEQLVRSQSQEVTPPAAVATAAESAEPKPLVRQSNETATEFALREELTKTRALLRDQRGKEVFGEPEPAAAPVAKPAIQPNAEVLKKYKPAEIAAVEEVVKALGYVKGDQLQTQTYAEKGQAQLDAFLEKHPEYAPENDPKGVLWNAFKAEFGLYKPPADPRDFPRIFNRVHATVFGIQPQETGGKTAAATEKITVASSGRASAPSNTAPASRTQKTAPAGVRADMLKGFTPEERAEMGLE